MAWTYAADRVVNQAWPQRRHVDLAHSGCELTAWGRAVHVPPGQPVFRLWISKGINVRPSLTPSLSAGHGTRSAD